MSTKKSLVQGIHHVALKCENEAMFEKTVEFYTRVLGLPVLRSWGTGERRGIMLNTGCGILEIFAAGRVSDTTGTVNHLAFAAVDVDSCIAAVHEAGYAVTVEPKDIVIPAAVPFPARIAFCRGPVGEEIEFFCEK